MGERYSETQKRVTKEAVLRALIELMEEKSFHELSVTEIASAAGVSRAAFYRNYETKADIVRFYLRDLFRECLGEIRAMGEKSKYNRIRLFFSYFHDNGEQVSALAHDELAPVFYEEILPFIREFFESEADANTGDTVYAEYLTQYVSAGICRVLFTWMGNGMRESVDDMAGFVYDITGR